MFWFILSGLFAIFSAVCIYTQVKLEMRDEHNTGGYATAGTMLFVIAAILAIVTVVNRIGWQQKAKKYSFLDVIIENKLTNIEMMKESYRELSYQPDMSIDLVNKDLTQHIATQINKLEQYVNAKNIELAEWHVKYKYRFWTFCHTVPPSSKPYDIRMWTHTETKK